MYVKHCPLPKEQQYGCNNMQCKVCSNLIECIEIVPLKAPRFDQLVISIHAKGDIPALFEKNCGGVSKAHNDNGLKHYHYANGIVLSEKNEQKYRLLRFKGTKKTLSLVNKILKDLEPITKGRKPYYLTSAEVKWDMHFKGYSEKRVECILAQLNKIVIPQNKHARLSICSGKKKKTSDGATNGKYTYYYQQHEENTDGTVKPIANPLWHVKMYSKKLTRQWRIRFEVTLKGDSLHLRLPNPFPLKLHPDLNSKYSDLSAYLKFVIFDWGAFGDIAKEYAKHDKRKLRVIGTYLCAGHQKASFEQWQLAKKVASYLRKDWLKVQVRRGKFYKQIIVFKDV